MTKLDDVIDMRKAKRVFETRTFNGSMPSMVKNIMNSFGRRVFQKESTSVSEIDVHLLARIINDGLFGNRLPLDKHKIVVMDSKNAKDWKDEYKDMLGALGGFVAGCSKLGSHDLIVMNGCELSFYDICNVIIHELIHMYDFHFGEQDKLLKKFLVTMTINLNREYGGAAALFGPDIGRQVSRKFNYDFIHSMYGMRPEQVPDELRAEFDAVDLSKGPRQFSVPGKATGFEETPFGRQPVVQADYQKKYTASEFYDVHGDYFMKLAKPANDMGFVVRPTFDRNAQPRTFDAVWVSESGKPRNVNEAFATALYNFLRTDDHKRVDVAGPDAWRFEIS